MTYQTGNSDYQTLGFSFPAILKLRVSTKSLFTDVETGHRRQGSAFIRLVRTVKVTGLYNGVICWATF